MKYYGKEKCRILKEIRAEIARENGIEWAVSECKHKGNCKGTCPKCEQEVRQLEDALAKREALGKKVAVVGISASIALSVTGCVNPFPETTAGVDVLQGGATLPETETACDLPTAGVPVEYETDVAVDGEMPVPETTAEDDGDILMGAPVEAPTETEEERETEEVLMGDMPVD